MERTKFQTVGGDPVSREVFIFKGIKMARGIGGRGDLSIHGGRHQKVRFSGKADELGRLAQEHLVALQGIGAVGRFVGAYIVGVGPDSQFKIIRAFREGKFIKMIGSGRVRSSRDGHTQPEGRG